jgi:hypothetical protein
VTYVTDADLLTYLAAVLLKETDSANLPSGAGANVSAANQKAYDELNAVLRERGFSAAQVDAWDRRAEFNRDIAVYWVLVDYFNAESTDLWVRKYDRRDELKSVSVLQSGQWQPTKESRRFGYGPLQNRSDRIDMDTRF